MTDRTYKTVTHCIFDMDGLILDTETLYTEAFNRIAQRFGKEFTWEHKAKSMGSIGAETSKIIINLLDLPITPEKFDIEYNAICSKLFPKCNLMPGAEQLLRQLKNKNVPIALATSSSVESYELKSQKWKHVFDLFDLKTFGGSDPEVKKGKPHPDIFLLTAKRFSDNPDPSKCLVFEDSPFGVEAANRAGMQVVMVPDPMLPKSYHKNATLILRSLEDFRPEQFGLPPF